LNIPSVTGITGACDRISVTGNRQPRCTNGGHFDTNSGIAPARPLQSFRGHTLSTAAVYIKPRTLPEALASLASGEARILSGGTDFYPALGDGIVQHPVVDISALSGLRGIAVDGDFFRIGGLTTWTDIIRAPLPRCFDGLKQAAREIGSVQIQNRGTVAGNLCNASPAADGVPPLLALDAEIELASTGGTRRMKLERFIVGNRKTERRADEMLTAILVPRGLDNAPSVFLKLGGRRYLVISIAMVAAIVAADEAGRIATARIAVGSCSATARRLHPLENELVGTKVQAGFDGLIRPEHISSLAPISDVRATAEYRVDAALTLVKRALNACSGIA
jgi:CO/xanthine dehydrogenase FAD-binding subunit